MILKELIISDNDSKVAINIDDVVSNRLNLFKIISDVEHKSYTSVGRQFIK